MDSDNVNVLSVLFFFFLSLALCPERSNCFVFFEYFSFIQCATFTAVKKYRLCSYMASRETVLPQVPVLSHNTTESRLPVATGRQKHQACSWLGSVLHFQPHQGRDESVAPPRIKRCPSGAVCGLAAPGQQQYKDTEESCSPQSLQQGHAVFGDDHLGQFIGDEGDLMSHTNKDEGADHDVK